MHWYFFSIAVLKRNPVIWVSWAALLFLTFLPFVQSINNYWLSETPVVIKQVLQSTWIDIWIPVKDFYRPIAYSFWKLETILFGIDLRWLHLESILLHLLNASLLILLVYDLTRSRIASFVAGSFFALHWVHHQPVMWIASRETSLFPLFWLLSLLSYHEFLKKDNWVLYVIAILGYIFSFLTKESALSLPLYLATMGLVFHKDLKLKQVVIHMIPFVLIGASYLIFRQFTTEGLTQYDVIFKPTWMLANMIILVQHLFFPLFIVNFSDPWTHRLIASQKVLLAGILLTISIVGVLATYRLFRADKGAGFKLALLGFILTVVQLAFISPMGIERMLYSVSMGASILLAGVFIRIWEVSSSIHTRRGIGLALIFYLLAMWSGCFSMASFYEKASEFSHQIIEETKTICREIPDNELVFFIGTPSRLYTSSGVTYVDVLQFGIWELLDLQGFQRTKIYQNSRVKPPYRFVRNFDELNAFVRFVKRAYKPPDASGPIHFITYMEGHVRRVLEPASFPWEKTALYYRLDSDNVIKPIKM